jgi:heme-degrading monooxygenase HmoA
MDMSAARIASSPGVDRPGQCSRPRPGEAIEFPAVPSAAMIHQLRIYEIFQHNKAGFHDRFRDHAARIMDRYGFEIVAAWESTSDGRVEFVYLLAWPDADTMKDAWAEFLADEEWREIKRQTAEPLVGEIQDRVLDQVPYSPNRLG